MGWALQPPGRRDPLPLLSGRGLTAARGKEGPRGQGARGAGVQGASPGLPLPGRCWVCPWVLTALLPCCGAWLCPEDEEAQEEAEPRAHGAAGGVRVLGTGTGLGLTSVAGLLGCRVAAARLPQGGGRLPEPGHPASRDAYLQRFGVGMTRGAGRGQDPGG